MTSTLKRYTVVVTTWAAYRVEIDAANEEAAVDTAGELYVDNFDRFAHYDGGVTNVDAEESEVR